MPHGLSAKNFNYYKYIFYSLPERRMLPDGIYPVSGNGLNISYLIQHSRGTMVRLIICVDKVFVNLMRFLMHRIE